MSTGLTLAELGVESQEEADITRRLQELREAYHLVTSPEWKKIDKFFAQNEEAIMRHLKSEDEPKQIYRLQGQLKAFTDLRKLAESWGQQIKHLETMKRVRKAGE